MPHFLGVHAQQLLPLAGALIGAARVPWGRAAVWLVAAVYMALIAWVFGMAYAGVPLISLGLQPAA